MNYTRNKRYFSKGFGKLVAIGFIAAIILIGVGILDEESRSMLGWGVGVLAGTIGLLVLLIKITPSDMEIERQVLDVKEQLHEMALNKHGLTAEQIKQISPFTLGGYMTDFMGNDEKNIAKTFANLVGGEEGKKAADSVITAIESGIISGIKYKKGRDGRIRSSVAEFSIFLFSENQVFIYTQQFSLITPETKEHSQEYFYRDIVSISTETSKAGTNVFTIKVSGGDSENIPYGMDDSDIQKGITGFRQLIRDKKNA